MVTFPSTAFLLVLWEKKNMEDAIKGQEEEEMEKKRETKGGKKDGGRKKK